MRHEFSTREAVAIEAGAPAVTRAPIAVSGIGDGAIAHLAVTVDLDHALARRPRAEPASARAARASCSPAAAAAAPSDFRQTVFDPGAPVAIADAAPPFSGPLPPARRSRRPARLRAPTATGRSRSTTARSTTPARFAAGASRSSRPAAVAPAFVIDVRFKGGLTSAQQAAFTTAAARWARIITADVPSVVVDGETIDDIVIDASGTAIDGPQGILGQAGPTQLRPGSFLPAAGVMEFDTADLSAMEADGSLVNVITHEMGHVLGLGSIWDELGLRQGAGSVNPTFTGRERDARVRDARPAARATRAVPLDNVGGPGTRDAHWREAVFGNELMTGFLNDGAEPAQPRHDRRASRTWATRSSYASADPYALPSQLELAMLGTGTELGDHGGRGVMLVPPKRVLPDSALV